MQTHSAEPTHMTYPEALRAQLVEFLRGGSAHVDVQTALANVPEALYGALPVDTPHSLWQLLEHLRFTLRDLLDFCQDPNYVAPQWPDDYWPATQEPDNAVVWQASLDGLLAGLAAFEMLIEDPATDLGAKIPWGQGQTILREALLAIDHTSYHLGQIVLLRKQLGNWDH